MADHAYTQPDPLRQIIAATTLAVANTTTVFAPANPEDDLGVAAGTMFWQPECKGARFWINVSAISGISASLTLSIVEFNKRANVDGDVIIASAALIATGVVILDVYPGATTSANHVVSNFMSNYRIKAAVSNTTTPSVTFTVDVEYIP